MSLSSLRYDQETAATIKHTMRHWEVVYWNACNLVSFEREPGCVDVIGKHIETALENDYGLRKVAIPIDADEKEPKSKIYMTPNALTTTGPLMLLMPGIRVGLDLQCFEPASRTTESDVFLLSKCGPMGEENYNQR